MSMMRNLICRAAPDSARVVITLNRVNNRTLLSAGSWGCLQSTQCILVSSSSVGQGYAPINSKHSRQPWTTWLPFPSHESRHAQPPLLPHGIIFWLGRTRRGRYYTKQSHAHRSEGAHTGSADHSHSFLSGYQVQGQIIFYMEKAYTPYNIAYSYWSPRYNTHICI